MNALVVGLNKLPILDLIEGRCLVIAEPAFVEHVDLSKLKSVRFLDLRTHSFNPLKGISPNTQAGFLRAEEFVNIIDSVNPRGDSTLTKDTGLEYILDRLMTQRRLKLSTLIPEPDSKSPPGHVWAHGKIQRMLHSPVLRDVLEGGNSLSFTVRKEGAKKSVTLIACLDRAELGDYACRLLGNFLITQYRGTVVIPDFGFYQCAFHSSLIRQDRLIAGVNSFDEVPTFKSQLLLVKDKVGSHCTPSDAELLALYEGIPPGTIGHGDYIARLIRPA